MSVAGSISRTHRRSSTTEVKNQLVVAAARPSGPTSGFHHILDFPHFDHLQFYFHPKRTAISHQPCSRRTFCGRVQALFGVPWGHIGILGGGRLGSPTGSSDGRIVQSRWRRTIFLNWKNPRKGKTPDLGRCVLLNIVVTGLLPTSKRGFLPDLADADWCASCISQLLISHTSGNQRAVGSNTTSFSIGWGVSSFPQQYGNAFKSFWLLGTIYGFSKP